MQDQDIQQSIDNFLAQILEDKGYTDLDPEVKQGVVDEMRETLMRQMDKEAILRLSDEKAEELSAKLDDPNFTSDDMAQFLRDNGVNLSEVALETMINFRNFYIGTEGEDETE